MNDLTQIALQFLCILYVYVHTYFVHSQMTTVHCMQSLRMFITLQCERVITLTKISKHKKLKEQHI